MRIGVTGGAGRMGRLVAEAAEHGGAILVGCTSRQQAPPTGMRIYESALLLAHDCDVLVDFTHPSAIEGHAWAVAEAGCAWVLGTTGMDAAQNEAVRGAAGHVAIVQAANFSPGVNLVLALATRLAAALPAEEYDAEIVEMHHRQKVDAPSGTAIAIGRAIAEGRGVVFEDVAQMARHGQTGVRPPGAIGFASLRGGQVVGEHCLVFAGADEHIALTHKAIDRRVFALGALRAARWVTGDRPPGLYGMLDVLGMQAE